MGRDPAGPVGAPASESPRRTVRYVDAHGHPTDDPAAAVSGEIAEYGDHGRLRHRTSFFLAKHELPRWVPVSEPALLLWVLAGLMLVWTVVGLALHFT
jgi:hypothetical protein